MPKDLIALLLLFLMSAGCGRPSSPSKQKEPASIPTEDRITAPDTVAARQERIAREAAEKLSAATEPTPASVPSWIIQIQPLSAELILTQGAHVILQTNNLPNDGFAPDLAPGEYDLLIQADGYEPYRERLVIRKKQQSLYYTLRRKTGELRIKSNAGVSLTIESDDGTVRKEGVTTLYGLYETRLPEGTYHLSLSKADYRSSTHEFRIRQGDPARLEELLQGLPASIQLTMPLPVEIRENDQLLGTSGVIITNLAPGEHTFFLSAPGYHTEPLTVQLPPNRFVPLPAPSMTPAVGALSIRLRSTLIDDSFFPDAPQTLLLNDELFSLTNGMLFLGAVSCGVYHVTAQAPGYTPEPERLEIEIPDGRTQEVVIAMQPKPVRITFEVTPLPADIFRGDERLGRTTRPLAAPPQTPFELTLRREGYMPVTLTVPPLPPGGATNLQATLEPAILIEDLIVNPDAHFTDPDDLAEGSRGAVLRQRSYARQARLPLEVTTRVGAVPLRLIPPGFFAMGSPYSETGRGEDETQPTVEKKSEEIEEPQPEVEISRGFYIGRCEITRAQWQAVMGRDPVPSDTPQPDAPVTSVTWDDCQTFLTRLCEQSGVPPGTYRLPTEAEWEYACRAGTGQATYLGDTDTTTDSVSPMLDRIAWYAGNTGADYAGAVSSSLGIQTSNSRRTLGARPVAQKEPNAWGLYDTLGNVWEWCGDFYQPYYDAGPLADPAGPEKGASRVCRGGSWTTRADRCRAAERYANSAAYCDNNLGLRILRLLPAENSR